MIAENQSTQNTASDSQGLSAEFRAKLITDERAIAAAQLAYHKAVITPAIAHGEQPPVELASPPVGPGSNTRLAVAAQVAAAARTLRDAGHAGVAHGDA